MVADLNELKVLDKIWEELFPKEQERIARLLIETVTVYEDRLEVAIKPDGLVSLISELKDDKHERPRA